MDLRRLKLKTKKTHSNQVTTGINGLKYRKTLADVARWIF